MSADINSKITVSGLYIYPIKSCAAISMNTLHIGPRGPLHDREWMLIDAGARTFLTQRELPALALVKTALQNFDSGRRTEVAVEIPQESGGSVHVQSGVASSEKPEPFAVAVFGNPCLAVDEGDEIAEAFSDYLKREVRLVRMAPEFTRPLAEKYRMTDETRAAGLSFADGCPVLLAAVESLAELNSRLQARSLEPVPMSRFRPNIVIQGAPAFAEDQWKNLRIGSVSFSVLKPCDRCVIVNTDQVTGVRGAEPLKTLATYRRGPKGVMFAQYLVQLSDGALSVGDELSL